MTPEEERLQELDYRSELAFLRDIYWCGANMDQ